MHGLYSKASHASGEDMKKHMPVILDLLTPATSLLFQSLQYLSKILSAPSRCSRLLLICYARGCRSVEQWLEQYPSDGVLVSRSVYALSAALKHRSWDYMEREFGCLRIGDPRLPENERLEIAKCTLAPHKVCKTVGGLARFLWLRDNGAKDAVSLV